MRRSRQVGSNASRVFGPDERADIKNTTQFPYNCICRLKSSICEGSGWLVNSNTVVTAGHVLFDRDTQSSASEVNVWVAQNGSQTWEISTENRTAFRIPSEWKQQGLDSFDFAAVKLSQRVHRAKYLKIGVLPVSTTLTNVNVAGYPGDRKQHVMYLSKSPLSGFNERFLKYFADTEDGTSGSPVFVRIGGVYTAIGIHTDGKPDGNVAVRINSTVANRINSWSVE